MDFVAGLKENQLFTVKASTAYKKSTIKLFLDKPKEKWASGLSFKPSGQTNEWTISWNPPSHTLNVGESHKKFKITIGMSVSSSDYQTQSTLNKIQSIVKHEKNIDIYLHKSTAEVPVLRFTNENPIEFKANELNKIKSFTAWSESKLATKKHPVLISGYSKNYAGDIIAGSNDIVKIVSDIKNSGRTNITKFKIKLHQTTIDLVSLMGCKTLKKRITIQSENTFTKLRSSEKHKNIIIYPDEKSCSKTEEKDKNADETTNSHLEETTVDTGNKTESVGQPTSSHPKETTANNKDAKERKQNGVSE